MKFQQDREEFHQTDKEDSYQDHHILTTGMKELNIFIMSLKHWKIELSLLRKEMLEKS